MLLDSDAKAGTANQPDAPIQMHYCESPGLTMEGVVFKRKHNALGGHYIVATAQIGSIFGSEVEGECSGIGRTREEALKRLREDQAKLYESLWAMIKEHLVQGSLTHAAGSALHLRSEVRALISWDAAMEAVCCLARDGEARFFAPYDAERLERAALNIRQKLAFNKQ